MKHAVVTDVSRETARPRYHIRVPESRLLCFRRGRATPAFSRDSDIRKRESSTVPTPLLKENTHE